jgi:hypothetical protein
MVRYDGNRPNRRDNRPLASRSSAVGFSGLSLYEIPKQLDWIGAKGASNRDKFDDVNAPLTSLILGDEGLRAAKLFSKSLLPNARGMSHRDKNCNQSGIFRGFEGLLHWPPSLRIGGGKFDPENGLSQNWII